MSFKEFEFINEIKKRFQKPKDIIGIGDDAAVLPKVNGRHLLWATDCLMENVHFDLKKEAPFDVGWKLAAVNISDMAAMGGVPETALLSIAIPPGFSKENLDELMEGLNACLSKFNTSLIGGDTSQSLHGLFLNLAVQGSCTSPVLRSGAKPGDWLMVTGALGGSILGRHLKVEPRVEEMLWLAKNGIHASIDISDGLSGESLHLANQSGCFVLLNANSIPIHKDSIKLSERSGQSPLKHALGDGEDFEVLVAVDPEVAKRILNEWPFHITLKKIGEFKVSGPNCLVMPDGAEILLEGNSFEHSF